MQRGRGVGDDFPNLGHQFTNLGDQSPNLGDQFAGFGGFGGHGNPISSLFGGRDPFDDPFFTRPFGSMFGSSMLGPSMFGPSMLGPSMFGPSMSGPSMFGPRGSFFGDSPASGFIEQEPPHANKSEGPIIKELNSDDEEVEEEGEKERASKEKKDNSRKHSRSSKDPYVEGPDDEAEGRRNKLMQYRNDYNRTDRTQPQARNFSFQSSTVTYGGADGAYYTSSTSRRAGSDGVVIEESKEADTTTRQAKHKLSRGLHDKGHSITRKLNSDGNVDTMQTLHNLDEDELGGFDEAWRGKARQHLPGWSEGLNMHGDIGTISNGQGQAANGGWALPSTGQQQSQGSGGWALPSTGQHQSQGSDGWALPSTGQQHSQGSERMRIGGGVRPSTSKGRARSSTRINID